MTRPRELRQWRDSLGLTQAELAERIGCSTATVSMIERGTNRDPERIEAMRQALLDVAKGRRNDARWRRREEQRMRAVAEAWTDVPELVRQRLVHALCDLAWFKLDGMEPEIADGIGLAMPIGAYDSLLDEYFEGHA